MDIPTNQNNMNAELEGDYDADLLEPVAIIGLSLKFPQDATSTQAFWKMLMNGVSARTSIPKDRYNWESFYDENPHRLGTANVNQAHFLKDGIAAFDAPFFSITPEEASCMDPQQRLLLETAYSALENAGISLEQAAGSRTSVFIGSFNNDYSLLLHKDSTMSKRYLGTGTEPGMLANRLSWFFDLTGPSMQIDTACSSSLNALHLACQSIRHGESNMALVGGCNLFFNPEMMCAMSDLTFLSPDGVSYAFDHRANGYARGEGLGMVILKPLSRALEDGDTIRALVRATGSNQDGRTPSITQPDGEAQAAAIRDTYRMAGLDLRHTRYFEAHGTGTSVGDPIEVGAINEVFGKFRSEHEKLIVGALKPNIGHLEGASGIAGLIKTVLVLESGIIPPNIWYERANPHIPLHEWNIQFPLQAMPWPCPGLRRASVNSFGFGGSNSHAVVDDAYHYLRRRGIEGNHKTSPRPRLSDQNESPTAAHNFENGETKGDKAEVAGLDYPMLLVLSASDEHGLERWIAPYQAYLKGVRAKSKDRQLLQNLALTLASKRSHLAWRFYLVVTSDSVFESFTQLVSAPFRSKSRYSVSFVFTGQGAHWSSMGVGLLRYPVFQEALQEAQRHLQEIGCSWRLLDELSKDDASSRLGNPAVSQPICTALQIAIVKLLRSWNIEPIAVIGHSSGEIAAACCSGAISDQHALKIAYLRGLAISTRRDPEKSEAMMAVSLSESELQPYISASKVSVACINSPRNVTLSGDRGNILEIQQCLTSDGITTRLLHIDCAYHTAAMDNVGRDYLNLLRKTDSPCLSMSPKCAMVSSVSGQVVSASIMEDDNYWVRNLTSPVRFSSAFATILDNKQNLPIDMVIEIGPSAALRSPIKECLIEAGKGSDIEYQSVLVKGSDAVETAMQLAGKLHSRGFPVHLGKVNQLDQTSPLQMLTDLPSYPFNHSQSYWIESRLSKNFRFRKYPEHELLGTAVDDWNPLDARWRKIFSLSDVKWLADHKVKGSVLLPAVAIMAMAIEAATRLVSADREILAYRIQNASFTTAIVIPADDSGTEIEMRLGQDHNYGEGNRQSLRRIFQLFVSNGQDWSECSHGSVIVDYKSTTQDAVDGTGHCRPYTQDVSTQTSGVTIQPEELYSSLSEIGMHYGPAFQTLTSVTIYDQQRKSRGIVRPSIQGKSVLHPTMLDGMFQLIFPALQNQGHVKPSAMLPTRVDDVWVSAQALSCSGNNLAIQTYADGSIKGLRHAEFAIEGRDLQSGVPLISTKGFRAVFMGGAGKTPLTQTPKKLCYNICWQPSSSMLSKSPSKLPFSALNETPQDSPPWSLLRLAERVWIRRILQNRSGKDAPTKSHLRKQLEWMQKRDADLDAQNPNTLDAKWTDVLDDYNLQEQILSELATSKVPACQLCFRIGTRLEDIIDERADVLELLFKDDLLTAFYLDQFQGQLSAILGQYIKWAGHEDPNLRIVEVGAGTGGLTRVVLEVLTAHRESELGTPRFSNYTFTDLSAGFYNSFQQIFRGNEHRSLFKTLDVEQSPADQGMECSSYDFVLAANVLHASKDLRGTLMNVRKLLKPGGKLVLVEDTNPDDSVGHFVFGLLPGWWLGEEDFRAISPLASVERWDTLLKSSGFSGLDLHWKDEDGERYKGMTVMVSTASTQVDDEQRPSHGISIIIDEYEATQEDIARTIQTRFIESGNNDCELVQSNRVHDSLRKNRQCIVLIELTRPVLSDITTTDLSFIQNIALHADSIVWVHKGSEAIDDPHFSVAPGLIRALQSEQSGQKFVTLCLETLVPIAEVADRIVNVFDTSMAVELSKLEAEYREVDGVFYIPRIVEAEYLSRHICSKAGSDDATPQLQSLAGPPRALSMGTVGDMASFRFDDEPLCQGALKPGELCIDVKASGIMLRDVLIASGLYDSTRFGVEFSGAVVGTSSDLPTIQVGDRVCGWALGTVQTHLHCNASLVQKIPDKISYNEAASIPIACCTAYHSMISMARIKANESILIHSATGGTGQAAIQLAKHFGLTIFATAGNEEKKTFLQRTFGIPEAHIFSSKTCFFKNGIKTLTGGRGVDVVINSLRDEAMQASVECLAPFGRFIELGRKNYGALSMVDFAPNISFMNVDLSHMIEHDPAQLREAFEGVMHYFAEGIFTLQPLTVFGVSQIEEAFRHIQGGKAIGKVAIDLTADEKAMVASRKTPAWTFDAQASYLIAGGLGGIGRSVARWMVERGARNLIMLARSANLSDAAVNLLTELREKGARIETPPCDIADADALARVLEKCMQTMPPIKGCIQSAFALSDGPFQTMTAPTFHLATRPKILGSWNLHTLLPPNLDFFILFSSIQGIVGSAYQANYACGNVFQDALASHRVRNGQKALSLDIGLMRSVGVVAEHREVEGWLETQGYMGLEEGELHAILDYHCDPGLHVLGEEKCQVLTGLYTPAALDAKGLRRGPWLGRRMFTHLEGIGVDEMRRAASLEGGAEAEDQTAENTARVKGAADLVSSLQNAATLDDACSVICDALVHKLSTSLGVPAGDLDIAKPAFMYGADSLSAIGISHWLEREVGSQVSVFEILERISIGELAGVVARKSAYLKRFL